MRYVWSRFYFEYENNEEAEYHIKFMEDLGWEVIHDWYQDDSIVAVEYEKINA